jgi:hypothetical protein
MARAIGRFPMREYFSLSSARISDAWSGRDSCNDRPSPNRNVQPAPFPQGLAARRATDAPAGIEIGRTSETAATSQFYSSVLKRNIECPMRISTDASAAFYCPSVHLAFVCTTHDLSPKACLMRLNLAAMRGSGTCRKKEDRILVNGPIRSVDGVTQSTGIVTK